MIARRGLAGGPPGAVREIDTAQLGPIRIDHDEIGRKREEAERVLERHSPRDVIAGSDEERRRWVLDAMVSFANQEVRRDREMRRA